MIKIFILFALVLLISSNNIGIMAQDLKSEVKLMPIPQKIEWGEGKFRIEEKLSLQINLNAARIQKASNRFLQRLSKKTGLFLENPFSKYSKNPSKNQLNIIIEREGRVTLDEDESYILDITHNLILLKSKTDIGALWGLETLLQLIESDDEGYYFRVGTLNDYPRFPWRGLMIDACRHFIPVEVIKRNLDGMASVKMNTFHWHLSEDQGFRVESKIYPKLHELASDGLYYTQEQIRDIIAYADERGIRVIPEFDVPGHATAILSAYPELASAPGPYQIEREWGIFDPTINPINEKTYTFLENLFNEMCDLFTGEHFHIGGDENNGKQWNENEEIQKFMTEKNIADNHELQSYFNKKLLNILNENNKIMVGWDEILHESMPNNVVIQSWRGTDAIIESAKKGFQTILSEGYYIDLMQPTDFHYLNDPIPIGIQLDEAEKKLVLGGEATMWSEMTSPETIDSRIWPRTAAIAERLWSSQRINNVNSMYKRLEIISFNLEEHGLTHLKNHEMMLRRLTNNNDIQPLKNLVAVIEPVKIYKRNELKKQTQQTPLTRVVDAASADAKVARDFRTLIEQLLSQINHSEELILEIKACLELWKHNHEKLKPIIAKSPILIEIEPLSESLSDLGRIGLEILEIKLKNSVLGESERKEFLHIIQEAMKPVAQTELMIVSSIEDLVHSIK